MCAEFDSRGFAAVGPQGGGKTALAVRWANGDFVAASELAPTIISEFGPHQVVVVDISGDRATWRAVYAEWLGDETIDGFVLVFDVSDEASWRALPEYWHAVLAAVSRGHVQAARKLVAPQAGQTVPRADKAGRQAAAKLRKKALAKLGKQRGGGSLFNDPTRAAIDDSQASLAAAGHHSLVEELAPPPMLVVGTHADRPQRFATVADMAAEVWAIFGAPYIEVSALSGANIDAAVAKAVGHVRARHAAAIRLGAPLPVEAITRSGWVHVARAGGRRAKAYTQAKATKDMTPRWVVYTAPGVWRMYASEADAAVNVRSEVVLLEVAPASLPLGRPQWVAQGGFVVAGALGALDVVAPSAVDAAAWVDALNASAGAEDEGRVTFDAVQVVSSDEMTPARQQRLDTTRDPTVRRAPRIATRLFPSDESMSSCSAEQKLAPLATSDNESTSSSGVGLEPGSSLAPRSESEDRAGPGSSWRVQQQERSQLRSPGRTERERFDQAAHRERRTASRESSRSRSCGRDQSGESGGERRALDGAGTTRLRIASDERRRGKVAGVGASVPIRAAALVGAVRHKTISIVLLCRPGRVTTASQLAGRCVMVQISTKTAPDSAIAQQRRAMDAQTKAGADLSGSTTALEAALRDACPHLC
ncbi:uncharacterized protein AMSG_10660 [Thecamonas trahens ATCC 50062]|uniref:PH domain-containing protein n=1 Tax=Thecamonas trahens ATCC 50062 TaxID=461836 RepID=A0A0L0DRY7_THETB|nr:hypothetical protein AMSG_10660 [Thecamonas trahens ATCC 50062]KNC55064.1 hypothetical protein AMSG_10660 [Thecamonas trahens ATCC 50062]|eukprot:XP_013753368.1 hypothetical protein AMSG_10660 [Thecamonas trahens ATCC 50062]